jgi:phage N-6-adenine-methyltransferase
MFDDSAVMPVAAEVRPADDLGSLAAQINTEHDLGEDGCWNGAEHYRTAGEKLIRAREECGNRKFKPWLEKNIKPSRRRVYCYIELAKKWPAICVARDTDSNKAMRMVHSILAGKEENDAHVGHNSRAVEWYTPKAYIDAARLVLGGIDLDPASSDIAQQTVQATTFYTKHDNGLKQPWAGRVWMNPPYSAKLIDKFMCKLVEHFSAGDVTAAITLTNNSTDTAWFKKCADIATAVCFATGRVKFLDPDGNPGAPLQGQAIMYFGTEPDKFGEAYAPFGHWWPAPRAAR